MPAFIDKDGAAVEVFHGIAFVDRDGIQRPANWLDLATASELAAAQVRKDWPVEPPVPPAGKTNRLTGLVVEGGVVRRAYVVEDVPPPPPSVPASISDRQFAQILAIDGVITQDEALAWAARGDLPDTLEDAVMKIPNTDGQRFGARMLLSAATNYDRSNALVDVLGKLLTNPATGKPYDAAALDSLWIRGANL